MINDDTELLPADSYNALRSAILSSAIFGTILGILLMVFNGAVSWIIGLLFGISLIGIGLYRLFMAFLINEASMGLRIVFAVVGGVIVGLGVWLLIDNGKSQALLAVIIGIGWILTGLQELFGAQVRLLPTPRWLVVISGLIGVAAGIAMIVIRDSGLSLIVWVSGAMLIVMSIATILTLPKKAKA